MWSEIQRSVIVCGHQNVQIPLRAGLALPHLVLCLWVGSLPLLLPASRTTLTTPEELQLQEHAELPPHPHAIFDDELHSAMRKAIF